MFLFRKNIILVPSDYDGISFTKGLLSLDCFDDKTKCTLRCYNLECKDDMLFGVAIGTKLNKIKISKNSAKNVPFDLDFPVNSNQDISCVLLNIKQDDYNIVLWGSTEINNNWKSTLEMMLKDDDVLPSKKEETRQNVEKSNFEVNQKKDDDVALNSYIDKVIKMTETDNSNDLDSSSRFENEQKENQKDIEPTFFERINPQIEKMFASNPTEQVLDEIIPNSKFCKVDFDDNSGYYVFGVIYDNSEPKYLCYGVPAKKDSEPPKELTNFYQWLPIDVENQSGDGYYMMYQDATNGNNISVDII